MGWVATGHSPGEPEKPGKIREFKSDQGKVRGKKEKSGKVCSSFESSIWSITASIDLDTRYSCASHEV